jgi:hypothetical protein
MDTTRSSDDVLLARELVAEGFGYAELSRLVRRGELEHLRRGALLDPGSAIAAGAS